MAEIVAGTARLMQQLDALQFDFTVDDLIPGAVVILEYAQSLCPVDTGFLRDSGYVRPTFDQVEIGFDADYASYVEFGTYKMSAQPFLRPALDEAEGDALNAIIDHINAHLGANDFTSGGVQTAGNPSGTLQP